MQYTAIFHGYKNKNFQLNFFDYFHIFAQNIYCGYTLEQPHWGGSIMYPQSGVQKFRTQNRSGQPSDEVPHPPN